MRTKNAARLLSTMLAIVGLGTASAQAATLDGSSVTGALYYPTSSTLYYSNPQTVVIGPAVEFPSGLILGDSSFQIDVTSNQLIYHPLQSVQYGGGVAFNGFKFTFLNSPQIIGISVNNASSTFAPSNPDAFGFTANTLSFNVQGLSVTSNDFLVFDIVLAEAIPEPSTWAMVIVGIAGMAFMAYRRSRKDRGPEAI